MSSMIDILGEDFYSTDNFEGLPNTENSNEFFNASHNYTASDDANYINPAILDTTVYPVYTQSRTKVAPVSTNSHDFEVSLGLSQQSPVQISEFAQLPEGPEFGAAVYNSHPICSIEVPKANVRAVEEHSSTGKRSKSVGSSPYSKLHRLKKRRRYDCTKTKETPGNQNVIPALSKVASAGCSHWLRSYGRRPTVKEVYGLHHAYNAPIESINLWFKCQADIDRAILQKCKRPGKSDKAPRQVPSRDEKKPYVCTSFCGKICKTKDEWKRHEETHFPQEFWFCSIRGCQEKSKVKCINFRKDHYRSHLRTCHDYKTVSEEDFAAAHSVVHGSHFDRRCIFRGCDSRFNSWKDRIDHIAKELEKPWEGSQWRGSDQGGDASNSDEYDRPNSEIPSSDEGSGSSEGDSSDSDQNDGHDGPRGSRNSGPGSGSGSGSGSGLGSSIERYSNSMLWPSSGQPYLGRPPGSQDGYGSYGGHVCAHATQTQQQTQEEYSALGSLSFRTLALRARVIPGSTSRELVDSGIDLDSLPSSSMTLRELADSGIDLDSPPLRNMTSRPRALPNGTPSQSTKSGINLSTLLSSTLILGTCAPQSSGSREKTDTGIVFSNTSEDNEIKLGTHSRQCEPIQSPGRCTTPTSQLELKNMKLGAESPELETEDPRIKAEREEIEPKSTTAALNTPDTMALEQQRNPGTQASKIRPATPLRHHYNNNLHSKLSSASNKDEIEYRPINRSPESSTVSILSRAASTVNRFEQCSRPSSYTKSLSPSAKHTSTYSSPKAIHEPGSRVKPKVLICYKGTSTDSHGFPTRSKCHDARYHC